MKTAITIALVILGVIALWAIITTALAYLFMWIGAPKWVAWTVAIAIMIIGSGRTK